MTNDAEYLFLCLLAIFGKMSVQGFCLVKSHIVSLLLSFKSSLYILYNSSLSIVSLKFFFPQTFFIAKLQPRFLPAFCCRVQIFERTLYSRTKQQCWEVNSTLVGENKHLRNKHLKQQQVFVVYPRAESSTNNWILWVLWVLNSKYRC